MNHENTAPQKDTVELEELGALGGNTNVIFQESPSLERQLEDALEILDTDAAQVIIQKIRERNAKQKSQTGESNVPSSRN